MKHCFWCFIPGFHKCKITYMIKVFEIRGFLKVIKKRFKLSFARQIQDKFKCRNNFNKSFFIGSYSLMVILGLTWILGFIYFADGAEALAILFTITNSLQGVAIFIFHVILHEKARFCLLENLRNMRRNVYNLKVCLFINL